MIAAIAVIVILSVAIVAYVHFSSSTAASSPSLSTATVSIDPSTLELQTAKIGQTINVNINVSNVQKLWCWELADLTFNSSVLNLTQVQEGPFMKSKGQTFFISTASVPAVQQGDLPSTVDAFAENTTVSGSGVLATLKFTVLSAGNSLINLTSATLFNPIEIQPNPYQETGIHDQINSTVVNGNVVIDSIIP